MRSIVVTGAAGGIGQATLRALAADDLECICVDVPASGLDQVLESTKDLPGKRVAVVTGLANEKDCAAVVGAASHPLAGLVHLAGVYEKDMVGERHIYDRAIEHNLTNAYLIGHAVRDAMGEQGQGAFVFTSSLAFNRGAVNNIAYSASKGGIVGMTRAMSRRFAPKIRVNAIAPGIIDTAMTVELMRERGDNLLNEIPLGRVGRPEDIAGVIAFLLSDAAAYITGQTINVDGGIING